MLRTTLLALAREPRVRRAVQGFGPTRALVDRFVAGESVDAAIATARTLVDAGLLVTLDHLGEDVTDPGRATATVEEYLALLDRLDAEGLTASVEVSVKPSAIGLALPGGPELALANARRICARASAVGTTVTFDAEDHTTTDATLALLDAVRRDHPATGGVLQAYLHRTPADCRRLAHPGSRIRLCKGAYDEPATVALRERASVDAQFLACLRILVKGECYPMVATHDPRMIEGACSYADLVDREPGTWELQMLYGIRSDEQRRLAAEGHRVRVYVPYGSDWYAYFMRRLAERPGNLLFFGRALAGRR